MFASRHRLALVSAAALVASMQSLEAFGQQFPTINPAFQQEIYTGPLQGGPGMAWNYNFNLLTRNGGTIIEYSPTQNATHMSTPIHAPIANHPIAGLSNTGVGMTNGTDGYIYCVTAFGLQRFDLGTFGAAQNLPGTVGGQGYGINTLPDGRIVYSDGVGVSNVYIYDHVATTNTLIYSTASHSSGGFLIDDIETGPGGQIALAGQSNSGIVILNNTGGVIADFPAPHYPDGLAFGAGPFANSIFSNNNDGTITRYDMNPGWVGVPTNIVDIASGAGAYGDLAAVGPDCAFYVSSFENGSYHGATPTVGTNWIGGTNAEASITRISLASLTGIPGDEECGFYSLVETTLPEPGIGLISMIAAPVLLRRRR
jgi:hypothetical protein